MSPSISILTVTYGNRFQYLKQVITACLRDKNLTELIIVDNASQHQKEIEEEINKYSNKKIKYIRLEENTGSAGGFATGMEYFLSTNNDYLLLLDDDNVPEENFLKYYLNTLFLFEKPEEVVLVGNRRRICDDSIFYGEEAIKLTSNSFFMFNIFDGKRNFKNILKHIFKIKSHNTEFYPITQIYGVAFGGTFISKKNIEKVGIVNRKLFLYADDTEFGIRILEKDIKIYKIFHPFIEDIDMHNYEEGILNMFSKNTSDFRVYYVMRNNSIISKKYLMTNKFLLKLNIFIFILVVNILFIFKKGFSKFILRRNKLIIKAIKDGFNENYSIKMI